MKVSDFKDFLINEGAYISDNGKIDLSFNNDDDNPNEVLKSVSFNKPHYEVSNDDSQGYKVCYGLDYSLYDDTVDHPGRFKATMDLLKDGKINDASNSVDSFLSDSYSTYDITDVDYIVSTESSKGLNKDIVNSTRKIFPNAQVIDLKKVEFENPGLAINWKELERQVEEQSMGTAHRFIAELAGMLRRSEEFPNFNPNRMKIELRECKTVKELKDKFYDLLKMLNWKEKHRDGKPLVPFKMRSSGFLSRDGLRDFFYHKYDLNTNDYSNAVMDCIMNKDKKMLFIDDNINSGMDTRGIAKQIDQVALGMDIQDFNYRDNFTFYVFYSMSDKKYANPGFVYRVEDEPGYYSLIGKHSDFVKSFEEYMKGNPYSVHLDLSNLQTGSRTLSKYKDVKSKEAEVIRKETKLKADIDARTKAKQNILSSIESNYGKKLVDLIADEITKHQDKKSKATALGSIAKDISAKTGQTLAYIIALYYDELLDNNNKIAELWPFDRAPLQKT